MSGLVELLSEIKSVLISGGRSSGPRTTAEGRASLLYVDYVRSVHASRMDWKGIGIPSKTMPVDFAPALPYDAWLKTQPALYQSIYGKLPTP